MIQITVGKPIELFKRLCFSLARVGPVEKVFWDGSWALVNSRWNSYWHRVTYTHWEMREKDWTYIIPLIRRRSLESFVSQIRNRYVDLPRLAQVRDELVHRSKNRTSFVISYQFRNTSIVRKGCCLTGMHLVREDGVRRIDVHFDTSVQEVLGLLPGDLWLFDWILNFLGLLPRNKETPLGEVYHTNAKWFWYRDYTFALVPLVGRDQLSGVMTEEVNRGLKIGKTHGLKRVRRYYQMSCDMMETLHAHGKDRVFSEVSEINR